MITIASIQVGQIRTEGDPAARDVLQRRWTTGFYKYPIPGPVEVRSLGIDGDAVADTVNHGGPDKAMLCYPLAHYQAWAGEHPGLAIGPGGLGENLTVSGATEADVCIGDLIDVGTTQLQISQPRQPCWKIARRWGVKTLTKEVAQKGRTGWYVRVVKPGQISVGDPWELKQRPHPDWSVSRANDVLFGRLSDRMAVMELMNLKELAEAWRDSIA